MKPKHPNLIYLGVGLWLLTLLLCVVVDSMDDNAVSFLLVMTATVAGVGSVFSIAAGVVGLED